MSNTAEMTVTDVSWWRTPRPAKLSEVAAERAYARRIGARAYEWSGTDREGNPLTVAWTAGKRAGQVLSVYEIRGA